VASVTYRESCGTARGAMAHQGAGERLCGWCAEAEAAARLRAEAYPSRPQAPGAELLAPVTARQASINRAALDKALEGVEWEPDPTGHRLHVIKGSAGRKDAA
jgi:hypothetical protein